MCGSLGVGERGYVPRSQDRQDGWGATKKKSKKKKSVCRVFAAAGVAGGRSLATGAVFSGSCESFSRTALADQAGALRQRQPAMAKPVAGTYRPRYVPVAAAVGCFWYLWAAPAHGKMPTEKCQDEKKIIPLCPARTARPPWPSASRACFSLSSTRFARFSTPSTQHTVSSQRYIAPPPPSIPLPFPF